MEWFPELVVAIAAFLVGSFPTGYLVARAYGVDIRQVGSGNIGATNVLRSVNRWAGRGVFVVDMLKGFLPPLLAPLLLPQPDNSIIQVIACFFAILGHNYTPWLGFRGGKGVATAAGGFLAICWPALLLVAAAWVAVRVAMTSTPVPRTSAMRTWPRRTGASGLSRAISAKAISSS